MKHLAYNQLTAVELCAVLLAGCCSSTTDADNTCSAAKSAETQCMDTATRKIDSVAHLFFRD